MCGTHGSSVDAEGAAVDVGALRALAVHQEQAAREATDQQALARHQQRAEVNADPARSAYGTIGIGTCSSYMLSCRPVALRSPLCITIMLLNIFIIMCSDRLRRVSVIGLCTCFLKEGTQTGRSTGSKSSALSPVTHAGVLH